MNNENITNPDYKVIPPFKGWVIENFPFIEADFDAITNYQLLSKVVEYLNQVIANENLTESKMLELITAYNNLKDYIDNYFANLDVQEEINTKLDAMALDGSLTNLIKAYVDPIYEAYETEINNQIGTQNNRITTINNKVNSVASGSPLVASSTAGMTDTDHVYVNTSDGKWYYYDGDSWEIGGTYQTTGIGDREIADYNIADKGITLNTINGSENSNNYYDIIDVRGKYLNNNEEVENANYCYTKYIPVKYNDSITVNNGYSNNLVLSTYDKNKTFINQYSTNSSGILEYSIPANTYYVRFNIAIKNTGIIIPNLFENYTINNISIFAKTSINSIESIIFPYNLYNVQRDTKANINEYVETGKYYTSADNVIVTTGVSANWNRVKPINVKKGDTIKIKNATIGTPLFVCDNEGNVLFTSAVPTSGDIDYIIPSNSVLYCNIYVNDYDDYDLIINGVHVFDQYGVDWITLSDEQINRIKEKSVWYGKDLEIFGDSLVIGTELTGNYVTHLTPLISPATFTNKGISGRPMANGTPNGDGTNTTINAENSFDYDLVIIAVGTNDFKLNVPLGDLGLETDISLNTNTFYGAYKDALNHILSINPSIRIVLWTPLQRDNSGYDVNYVNSAGCKLIDYVNAIKNIGQMYSIPVLDLYSTSGVTKRTLSTYTSDGLHLNSDGYELVCRYIANYLNII